MGMTIGGRLKHAWNAFVNRSEFPESFSFGQSFGSRPYVSRMRVFGDKTILGSIYTKIAIDVAAVDILHVRVDDNGRYLETIDSHLNNCLVLEANIDQAATAFRQDIVMTLFDEGVIAIVPVDTTINPKISGAWDVDSLRVGKIVQWYPRHVRINLYNDQTGNREEITMAKKDVAIVENPLYNVMNEPNSTLQRLISKLGLLDAVDDRVAAGKLDLIIQLPYVIKSETRKNQAENRRKDIEMQLQGSQYGIAYTDGTERITQLNRPAENSLQAQVEYLTAMLYSQLGLTKDVFEGTADEQTLLNYQNRTVVPILKAVVEAMRRTFLTKTARSQGQTIMYFRDPFQNVPLSQMADIADKFSRNQIMTPNEIRGVMAMRPSKDPSADELRNKNMPAPDTVPTTQQPPTP